MNLPSTRLSQQIPTKHPIFENELVKSKLPAGRTLTTRNPTGSGKTKTPAYARFVYFRRSSISPNFRITDPKSDKGGEKKRRKSRWAAPEADKTFIPGMPTILPTNLTKEQEEAYLRKCKLGCVTILGPRRIAQ